MRGFRISVFSYRLKSYERRNQSPPCFKDFLFVEWLDLFSTHCPPRRRPNMLFPTIVIIMILSAMEIDICVPSFPEIQSVYGISSSAVEFLLGINLLAHGIGALVAGNLGDRYGRKPIILSGLALFLFGSLTCALAQSYSMLLAGRLFQGIGIACPTVLAYVIIPDTYDIKTRQKLLGLLHFFTTIARRPLRSWAATQLYSSAGEAIFTCSCFWGLSASFWDIFSCQSAFVTTTSQ